MKKLGVFAIFYATQLMSVGLDIGLKPETQKILSSLAQTIDETAQHLSKVEFSHHLQQSMTTPITCASQETQTVISLLFDRFKRQTTLLPLLALELASGIYAIKMIYKGFDLILEDDLNTKNYKNAGAHIALGTALLCANVFAICRNDVLINHLS